MIQKVRITIDVEFKLNGFDLENLRSDLDARVERAVGNGLLAGDTAVEVDSWSSLVVPVSEAPSEDEMVSFFENLVNDGNMSATELVTKVVRCGLQETPDFIEEMRERMEYADDSLDGNDEPKTVVDQITGRFFDRLNEIANEHDAFILKSMAAMDPTKESISELQDDTIDELKGHLGSEASNQFEDDDDQEDAISSAEEWVADTVSPDLRLVLATVLWSKGLTEGMQIINDAIAKQ